MTRTKHHAALWRKRAIKKLPELARRVFALRTEFYPGCGFHWCTERALGRVMAILNDYDSAFDQISAELGMEMLCQDIAKAEAAIAARALPRSRDIKPDVPKYSRKAADGGARALV